MIELLLKWGIEFIFNVGKSVSIIKIDANAELFFYYFEQFKVNKNVLYGLKLNGGNFNISGF